MKKYRLNEALKSYDAFLNEADAEVQTEIADDAKVADTDTSGRDSMISDVDNIITSLETLAGQIQEDLESLEAEEVNEAGDSAGKKLLQWTITAPKAKKAQGKVNQMKINALDLEMAADAAEGDKKKALTAKLKTTKEKIGEIQTTVADRFDAKGEIVKNARLSAKIQGERELLKRLTGMEDNPKKKAEFKTQIAKLDKRQKEQTEVLKSLKPEDTEKPAEKPAEKSGENTADKIAQMEGGIKDYELRIEDTNQKIKNAETNIKKLEAEKEKSTDSSKIEKNIEGLSKRIEKDKEDVKDLQASRNNLKKQLAKLTAQESLVVRAGLLGLNELSSEIFNKHGWQFENNSALYTKYNTLISKYESDIILNESRYMNDSIKDAFARLI
jgi:hypothetical protein